MSDKTSRNDVTGDLLRSKPANDMFEEGWDRIFGKKKFECNTACGHHECNDHQGECKRLNKQSRIDTIGSNGNDGLHYTYELNKSTGEMERVEDGTTTNTQE